MALALGPPSLLAREVDAIRRRVPVRISWNPGGDAGIYRTLAAMRDASVSGARASAVVSVAHSIVGDEVDRTVRWRLLREWLAMHTQFLDDPRGLELIRTPIEQLLRIQQDGVMRGDCDDVATLAAALGCALGERMRYVVLGFGAPGPAASYRHVYAEMLTGADVWRDFDVTRRPGSQPPTRRATYAVLGEAQRCRTHSMDANQISGRGCRKSATRRRARKSSTRRRWAIAGAHAPIIAMARRC